MTKFYYLLICFLFSTFSIGQINPTLVDIPHQVFVNNGVSDFESILIQSDTIKKSVEFLFLNNEIGVEDGISKEEFRKYWADFKDQWSLIQFKENRPPLLIFQGLKFFDDEREYVEIYDVSKEESRRNVFSEVGKLLAYQIHPFTEEIVLFVHSFPCCMSASHNVYSIRQINGKLLIKDRFFVGRDRGDMVGPFFPDSVTFSATYHRLTQKTALRWSPAIVEKDAFIGWSASNLIIHYEAGAIYKILASKDNWDFVLFLNGISEEQSRMLNYTNFLNKGVYGWIKRN